MPQMQEKRAPGSSMPLQDKTNSAPRQAKAQNSTHHMEEIETTDEQSTYTF